MSTRRLVHSPSAASPDPILRHLLNASVVFHVLVAVLAFVHIGAGTASYAVNRFQAYGGAELVTLLASCAAAFGWQARSQRHFPTLGLFACATAAAISLWYTGLTLKDVDAWLGVGFRTVYVIVVLVLGTGTMLRLQRVRGDLAKWAGYGVGLAGALGAVWWLVAFAYAEQKSEMWPPGRIDWYATLVAGVATTAYLFVRRQQWAEDD